MKSNRRWTPVEARARRWWADKRKDGSADEIEDVAGALGLAALVYLMLLLSAALGTIQ